MRLTDRLAAYFKNYPDIDTARLPATSLASVVENPCLPLETLEDMAKVTVWIFTIDAVIDERLMPQAVLKERLILYEEIVMDKREDIEPADQYGTILLQLTKRIKSRPLYPELKKLWEDAYTRMIRGMLYEAYDKPCPAEVTLKEYLEHGQFSIGAPLYVISSWILQSEQSSLERLDELLHMLTISATSIRLANDLRTYEKERRENNLNAVFIKEEELKKQGAHSQAALQESLQYVSGLLDKYVNTFNELSYDATSFHTSLQRLTRFSVEFYRGNDFHTVSADNIHTLLQEGLNDASASSSG